MRQTGIVRRQGWTQRFACRRPMYAAAFLGSVLIGVGSAAAAEPGAFQVDVNTLLLAHFDQDARSADYAVGVQRFAGMGAAVVNDGYYGKAVDLSSTNYQPDFLASCDDYTPEFRMWGFYERGNIDYRQGTLEFWFRLPRSGRGVPSATIDCGATRNVRNPGDAGYASGRYNITTSGFSYLLPLLNGHYQTGEIRFANVRGFNRDLSARDWHHFAMCWSPGEWIVYLDGRPLVNYDMTGKLGHALSSNPVRYMTMGNCVLDELRISNCVRYTGAFEPRWRDGRRSAAAFGGNPDLKRFPARLEPVYVPTVLRQGTDSTNRAVALGKYRLDFDNQTGSLLGLAIGGKTAKRNTNGLALWEGLGRMYLRPDRVSGWKTGADNLTFTQDFAASVAAAHRLTGTGNVIRWDITLKNKTNREVWLYVLMGLPLPMKTVTEYFDGTSVKQELSVPRYKEMYSSTIPFVAAAGEGLGLGVGIDPHICLHAIPCEWIPEGTSGTIRQGAKLALSPGEQYTYTFYVVANDQAHFGTLDVLDRFHGLFPDLYRLRPDVPIYSYMPCQEYIEYYPYPEHARIGYAGDFWGHGPGHANGDDYGIPELWANPKYAQDPSYLALVKPYEAMWRSPEDCHRFINAHHRWSFDNYYAVRRTHLCQDMTVEYIVRHYLPDFKPVDDPLCFGQYYYDPPAKRYYYLVNEYQNALGRHLIEDTINFDKARRPYSPGWINDMSHSPLIRIDDAQAKKTPGRAFSVDKGTYILRTAGRQQRYEVVNSLVDDGHRMSMWSDGGWLSYTLCAFSSAIAMEGEDFYGGTTGQAGTIAAARNLLGEKPLTSLDTFGQEATGVYHAAGQFTPRTLRDYYRYLDAQLTLFCIKTGVTLAPPYLMGRQISLERTPIMVECATGGHKLVSAARVDAPLWVVRAGKTMESLLVVGNEKPTSHATDVEVISTYFDGTPLFGAYFGGTVRQAVDRDHAIIQKVRVLPRDVAAFKLLGVLNPGGSGSAETTFTGDGMTIQVQMAVRIRQAGRLRLNTFGPMYRISKLTVNGRAASYNLGQGVQLPAGENTVTAEYSNRTLAFTKAVWDTVDLIKDGRTNFRIIAAPGELLTVADRKFPIGFEHGTAMMLNEFLELYDEEDGVGGNLKPAEILQQVADNYDGWTIRLVSKAPVSVGQVRIDAAARQINIEGRSDGDVRRAMVVLLRLIDRKYPHIGRVVPMMDLQKRWYLQDGRKPWDIWTADAESKTFFAAFADPQWLVKPILREEYEDLYANNNMNFAGRYQLRVCPYLFEPTYVESFVYGPLAESQKR